MDAEGLRPSCRAGLGGVRPAGGVAAAGAVFLPGRGAEPSGRWVLREGFPAPPGWDVPPCLTPDVGIDGPPGRGAREAAGGALGANPDAPLPVVTVVWLVLFTVLPPVDCVVLWVERDTPVPAAPGCGPLGGLDAEPLGVVPAVPERDAPPLGGVPAGPGRGLPD